jgi:predicted PurR-regulated permease PerM
MSNRNQSMPDSFRDTVGGKIASVIRSGMWLIGSGLNPFLYALIIVLLASTVYEPLQTSILLLVIPTTVAICFVILGAIIDRYRSL